MCLIEPICRSYELTLPNKLFEYAAAGLPMLASDMPVIASTIREWDIGEIADPRDDAAVVAALGRLLEPRRRRTILANLRDFMARNTWADERRRLAETYVRALGRS